MSATKPYSYHAQLTLLTQAILALKEARNHLELAFENEVAQGSDEAARTDYNELAFQANDLKTRVENHLQAVKELAQHELPDTVKESLPYDRVKELLKPIARQAEALGFSEQMFIDAARDAF